MKKLILASVLLGIGCGGGTTGTTPEDCSEFVVLSDEEISINGGVLPADTCWLVNENFNLARPLIVKEGVVIEVAQNLQFYVRNEGSLTVEGTEEKPVLFTGSNQEAGFWQGIEIASKNSLNSFDHVIVEYAGSKAFNGDSLNKGAVYLNSAARIDISNSTLRKNAGAAFVFLADATFTLENTEISENEFAGRIHPNHLGQISDSNIWTENATPSVQVTTGEVTTDQTWVDIGTSLHLEGRLNVDANLVIAPNMTISVAQENVINVNDGGSLNAVGTLENPIIFQGADVTPGFWGGIEVGSKSSKNIFDFVSIKGAGGTNWYGGSDNRGAIYLRKEAKLVITNSEISNSSTYAMIVEGDISGFSKNLIKDNTKALYIQTDQLASLAGDSTYENVTEPYIIIPKGDLTLASTWKKQAIPFRFLPPNYITISAALTIEAGVIMEFGQGVYLHIDDNGGSINAVGTENEKIIFTGADKIAGFWKGIEIISASSDNKLKHVEVLFGGSSGWSGGADTEGNINVEGHLDISDSKISEGAGFGIVNYGEIVGCTGVDLSGNAKGEMVAYGAGTSTCP